MKQFFGKRAFSNAIIVYCVLYMSAYLASCLWVLVKTGVNPGSCVTVAGGFFGGELLLCCLVYRFGKKQKTETEDNIPAKVNGDWSETV